MMNRLRIKIRRYVSGTLLLAFLPVAGFLLLADCALAQKNQTDTFPNGTDGLINIKRSPDTTAVKKLPPNEFAGSASSFKIGLGYILDGITYSKDAVFEKQLDSAGVVMDPKFKTRDFRILGSGVFNTKRYLAFKFAFMYDGEGDTWMVRESGLTIGVPELFGNIFVGRTKEGYSMVKVMNGHSPWVAERQMAADVIPILGDGIKWFGSLPKSRIFWNLGYYNDFISKGQGFSTFAWQAVARVGWLPFYDKQNQKVLHVAANLRYGKPLDGQITLKSRPEANPAPFVINTGKFNADQSTHIGTEIYYSTGRLLVGTEINFHSFTGNGVESHHFFGGDIVATYLLTRTKRPYNTGSSIFGFVPVTKSVFKGGWGEWEAVLRISQFDLNSGSIQGGKFLRITPMMNWYMSKILRTEFIYGYGVLNRYKTEGKVHMFQIRFQLTVM
jgi:phosphate-selective porin OprO/OprP